VDAGAAVTPDRHPGPLLGWELGERVGQHADVVGGVVGRRLADPQQTGELLTSSPRPVVKERQQRVAPERAFPRRGGAFLLRVRQHDRGVQVDPDRPVGPDRRAQLPDPLACLRPGLPHRGQRGRGGGGQRGDQARHGRLGRHVGEQVGLRAHHSNVGQAVTAQRDRDRQVQQHLAWIVHGTSSSPRPQPLAQRLVKPNSSSGLDEQRATRRTDQRLAASHYPQPSHPPVTVHPRSASQLRVMRLRQAAKSQAEQALPHVQAPCRQPKSSVR